MFNWTRTSLGCHHARRDGVVVAAASQIRVSKPVIPKTYRGWDVTPCEWVGWRATSPDYDASYEGPEDGWVSSGGSVDARTYEELTAEIDAWIEESEA